MKRIVPALLLAPLLTAFAPSASATTIVNLVASGPFTPGSLITLQTFVTANGGETDQTVFGAIAYPDALVDANPAGNSQVELTNWAAGALLCNTSFCVAFNQVKFPNPVAVNVTGFLLATTTFLIDPGTAPGTTISFSWVTTPPSLGLDWFGLTSAPGASITVVPEPTAVGLLGFGLLALSIASREQRNAKR